MHVLLNQGQDYILHQCYFALQPEVRTYTIVAGPEASDPRGPPKQPFACRYVFHLIECFLSGWDLHAVSGFNRWVGTWLDGDLTEQLNIHGRMMAAGSKCLCACVCVRCRHRGLTGSRAMEIEQDLEICNILFFPPFGTSVVEKVVSVMPFVAIVLFTKCRHGLKYCLYIRCT